MPYPQPVQHWINNEPVSSRDGAWYEKLNPATGEVLGQVARGKKDDVYAAVAAAKSSWGHWSNTPVIERANILRKATLLMSESKKEIAEIIHCETGKSMKDALGETDGAVELGFFIAGEGRRYYGRTTSSAMPHRYAYTMRQPAGICGLIIAANTPIANVAWKAFPALLCGNTAIMKPSEDIPATAFWFAGILREAGLPAGVFNVVQGFGEEAGSPLVEHEGVDLISFTGSVEVGKYIQKATSARLAKTCLELGGKNPFVVCDDADLAKAADWAILSAFSNAGQRCASGSRIIVFEKVYKAFRDLFVERTKHLKVGTGDLDNLGPVITMQQLDDMESAVQRALQAGAHALTGGVRLKGEVYGRGFFMAPTILENAHPDAEISRTELFGPITCLYSVSNLEEAIHLANQSTYGLTAAIHTTSIHRAEVFKQLIRSGVVSINGPTHGGEPHLPFGGLKNSGNGWREPGTEVLDIYSEWKTVYVKYDPDRI